jgi:hypothetical protein
MAAWSHRLGAAPRAKPEQYTFMRLARQQSVRVSWNYLNYWPALTLMVAKSLIEWWCPTLVLSPLRKSQLSYGATASILAWPAIECRHGGIFRPPLLVFSLLRWVPSRTRRRLDCANRSPVWRVCCTKSMVRQTPPLPIVVNPNLPLHSIFLTGVHLLQMCIS